MERVTGIGGLFFRAQDPGALSTWYEAHLGVSSVGANYDRDPWHQAAGPTVFAPFPQSSDYFGSTDRTWMVNFRVRDLDAMTEQLRAANIDVKVDPKRYPNGRFARLMDPESNPIELWEPAGLSSVVPES
jgi:predicted enzyme related to lactoylglutathione lyase